MAKETTVGQRISQLIGQLGISKNAFALSLDKTATVIQHLVDERNKPGFDLLCKIFEVYPNVSKDWLMQGQGSMFASVEGLPAADPVSEAPAQPAPAPTPAPEPSVAPAAPVAAAPTAEAPAPAPTPVTPPPASAPVAAAAPQPAAFVPAAAAAATPPPIMADAGWQNALYTQQMAHQLAMAEMRNQFLQEQQRMMQQMMEMMQRQLSS